MKSFKTVAVLRQPHTKIWTAMRDHLAEFAAGLPDIAEVTEVERSMDADGTTHIVNEWRAELALPPGLRSLIRQEDLGWTDKNSWDDRSHTCRWTIHPYIYPDSIHCAGQTTFEPALAGNGARVTFEGTLDIKAELPGVGKLLVPFVESIVTTIIPKNFRATLDAAVIFAKAQDS
jgi:hypothetical protein